MQTSMAGVAKRSEEELISDAVGGMVGASEELSNLYSKSLYAIALYITGNKEDAEDALQDSLLRAYLSLPRFQGRSSYYTWVTRIVINSSLMLLRKRRVRRETTLMFPSWREEPKDQRQDPERNLEHQHRHLALMRAMKRLERPFRKLVELRVSQNCSIKEAAHILKISETAARSRMHRALLRLRTFETLKHLT